MRLNLRSLVQLLVISFTWCTGCTGATRQVTLQYSLQPDHPEILDAGPSALRICVAKVDVDWEVHHNGGLRVLNGNNDWMWENLIRSQLESELNRQAGMAGKRVQFVDRQELDTHLSERDLQIADIVQGDSISANAKLMPIDLYVFGRINGQTTTESAIEHTPIPVDIPVPFIGGLIRRERGRPRQDVRRTMTFAGSLRAVDARSGRVWLTHDISHQMITEADSHPFGRSKNEMDLMPQEHEIRSVLEGQVRQFVGRMAPATVTVQHELKSSHNDISEEGIRRVDRGDYVGALELFQSAVQRDPDSHRDLFNAGFACEKLGRLREALDYYSRAASIADCDYEDSVDDELEHECQYVTARNRVQDRLNRGDHSGARQHAVGD